MITLRPICAGLARLAFIASAALLLLPYAHADDSQPASLKFEEGRHYHKISPAVPTDVAAGKVEVLELFWYGCPHCYYFEKYLKAWKQDKSPDVEFIRMPAVLNRGWVPHARAFYALEALDEAERIHLIFFEAIHGQGRGLRDTASMSRFLAQHGIVADDFEKAYGSLYVETKLSHANQRIRQYGSSSVPTIIVNGKYRSTVSDAGGFQQLLELTNYLVDLETP